jgi:dihydroorotase
MSQTTCLQGARVIDPATGHDAIQDVRLSHGRIDAIGHDLAQPGDAVHRLDGCWLLPGLVDLSARLREPGYEFRATLESEMKAALAGGITTLVQPPDTDPVLDEPGLVEMLRHRTRQLDQAHLLPLGAMTVGLKGEVITEMAELWEAGCVGFSQAGVPVTDTSVLLRAMQYARSFGFPLWLRAQDPWLSKGGVAASGAVASRLGLSGVSVQAETIALHTLFELQRVTGVRLHVCRLSSAAGVDLVRRAKAEGLPVTCDVSINHVLLTDVDIGFFDAQARLDPPLRGQRDRDAIVQGLLDGTIDAICSDHTPVEEDQKMLPFGEAEPGATGLELLASLVLSWSRSQRLAPSRAFALVTSGPVRVLGDRAPAALGSLQLGAPADLLVLDPEEPWRIGPNTLFSQGKHTPFSGYEMTGRVVQTWVGGHQAFKRAG